MEWSECINKRIVKSITIDKNLIKSLIKTSENKYASAKRLELDNVTAVSVFTLLYDSLRELLEALTIKNSYKIYNHDCYTAFLREIQKKQLMAIRFDRFRKIRNAINYYGKELSVDDTNELKEDISVLISEVKALLNPKIKTIIFDLDGMIHLSKGLFSIEIAKQYGISENKISEFFKNEYQLCRIGKLDTKTALKPYFEKWKFSGTIEDFLQIWFDYGEFDTDLLNLIPKLKANNIKCILVTNNESYRMNAYITKLSVFDKILTSYETGLLKPDKEMLDLILKESDCNKDEILFCDDKEIFVKAGKDYGFITHKYTNFDNFKRIVAGLDIL